jgi:DNA repair exonuclease SbcCD ATPase subunit
MIIRSIRLHPFAGTSDRTFTFLDGLNVLFGENEFGKSTLYNALQEVLFTGTNLTPAIQNKWGNRWFPKPGGDHARVSLTFEADGKIWHLVKVWGAGRQCLLREEGGTSLADPDGIAARIRGLLKWNEATWTRVLFTRQAELARTIDELAGDLLVKIDNLETRLKGMAAIPGDIPAEKMKSILDAEIVKQNSHWISKDSLPEGGRGIQNPWKVGVGRTLEAYYAKERAKERLDSLRNKEAEIQLAREQLADLEKQVGEDREFCKKVEAIVPGLMQRQSLEIALAKQFEEEKIAECDYEEWPQLSEKIISLNSLIESSKPDLTQLDEELKNARKREKGNEIIDDYHRIVKETDDFHEMSAVLSSLPNPNAALIASWEKNLRESESTRMHISALKLKISLVSKIAFSARIQEGLDPEKPLELEKGVIWESESSGRFRLISDAFELTVENGELDMDELLAKLEILDREVAEIKAQLGFDNPVEARNAQKNREEKKTSLEKKEAVLSSLLRKRERTDWDNWYKEYQQLPATRDSDFIEKEIQRKRSEAEKYEMSLQSIKQKLQDIEVKYESRQRLTKYILDKKASISSNHSKLKELPELPAGYASIDNFIEILNEKKRRSSESIEREKSLSDEIIRLSASLPEDNPDDLEADYLLKEKIAQRQKERSLSLLRIRKTLDEVLMKREEADPQQILAASVSSRFKRLSRDAYHNIQLGEEMQAEGKTALPFHTLSRGTLGSLALAMRLSLGDLYLDGMKGMLLLDDPFTEMDEGRRAVAIQEIKAFSAGHQVLLITCHESHKSELLASGAVSIKID